MSFVPTADRLAPDLSDRERIVLLARALWHEGYDDHLAGHITVNQGDGTLLCNPWLLTWEEFGPDDVIRIDLDGNVLEGDWPAPLGIPLHLELHKARPGIGWALHHHSRWGTVWADMKRVPPIHDQTAAGGGGQLVLVDEYDGNVGDANAAAKAVEKMGDADLALLAHHGVFVLGANVNAVYWRAASLERLLGDHGFEVVGSCEHVVRLLEYVRTRDPDVAIVDIRLPPTHSDEGLQAALTIRADHPTVGVLVLSQYLELGLAMKLLADSAEGAGYLLKDRISDVAEFVGAVRRVAAGGSAIDPIIVSTLLAKHRSDDPMVALTPREREVLVLMAEGRSNQGIADKLVITLRAVEKYVSS